MKLVGVSRLSATPELASLLWQVQPFAATMSPSSEVIPMLREVAFGTTDAPTSNATSARKRRVRIGVAVPGGFRVFSSGAAR